MDDKGALGGPPLSRVPYVRPAFGEEVAGARDEDTAGALALPALLRLDLPAELRPVDTHARGLRPVVAGEADGAAGRRPGRRAGRCETKEHDQGGEIGAETTLIHPGIISAARDRRKVLLYIAFFSSAEGPLMRVVMAEILRPQKDLTLIR
jgi:hypothetical protein